MEQASVEGVSGRLRDEGLALHHFPSLAEGQTKNEVGIASGGRNKDFLSMPGKPVVEIVIFQLAYISQS